MLTLQLTSSFAISVRSLSHLIEIEILPSDLVVCVGDSGLRIRVSWRLENDPVSAESY